MPIQTKIKQGLILASSIAFMSFFLMSIFFPAPFSAARFSQGVGLVQRQQQQQIHSASPQGSHKKIQNPYLQCT
jgi:hypothetical protein